MNIAEIEMALATIAEHEFDKAGFPFQFIECFKVPKATVTKLKGTMNKAAGQGELLWPKKLYCKPCKEGDVEQALDAMMDEGLTKTHKPQYLLVTDGVKFSAYDRSREIYQHGDFSALNESFDFFLSLAGIERYEAVEEALADIRAAGRLAKFYDAVLADNPDWNDEGHVHTINLFLTRVLFCMFAEDTGIFEQDLFSKSLNEYTDINGGDVGHFLDQIFTVMDTSDKERVNLPGFVCAFPYVNGGLFKDRIEIPKFTRLSRRLLIEAARLNWREINPDIFGSMIQAVVEPGMRGDLGMHYTSVPNIMKVLQPLFLLDLEKQFADSQDSVGKLNKLHQRLAKIRVFDPACGSGNFLIIAYRELRKLELRIYKRLRELTGELGWKWSEVKLSNFYGIEFADFASETAKLSLWIAEYQMNRKFADIFGDAPPALPLTESGNVFHGNACFLDWAEICPPSDIHETYIAGNPPFLGAREQKTDQKKDIRHVLKGYTGVNSLDYVCAWFEKSAKYLQISDGKAAFVATNSVCQGQSVSLFWYELFKHDVEIDFAHTTFQWSNNAKKNASVKCVVVGIRRKSTQPKYLYCDGQKSLVGNISPYLTASDTIFVGKISAAPPDRPELVMGNQAIDGGFLILESDEKDNLVSEYPESEKYLRPVQSANDFMSGISRYVIWLNKDDLAEALLIPPIKRRVLSVKEYRENGGEVARSLAHIPYRFRYIHEATDSMIVVPRTTSENRFYLPIGLVSSETILTDALQVIYDPEIYIFSVLSSKIHMVWTLAVAGRLKSDPRYSNTLVYNTFPLPKLSEGEKETLEGLAWEIIEARGAHAGKNLRSLYDPKKMPEDLLKVHRKLDEVFEAMYRDEPFKNDTERLEHLFKMYAKMTRKKAG